MRLNLLLKKFDLKFIALNKQYFEQKLQMFKFTVFSTFFIFLMKFKFLSHFSFSILLVFAMSNVFHPRFGKLFGLEEVVIFLLNVNVFVETLCRFCLAIFRKKSRRSAISLRKIRLCTAYFSI